MGKHKTLVKPKPLATAFVFSLFNLIFATHSVSALTYSQDVGVSFTFNPTFRLTVSSDLFINNLAPGTTSDSNIIDVNILTNNITGYSLKATVGNATPYNTRNLVHSTSGSSANFASINYGASLANLTTDNTWGYSYSTNAGSSWTNYSGLPLYSDTTNVATLKTSSGPSADSTGDTIKFKIAAKAASTQASGVYHNVINFIGAANVVPQYTVQFNANTGTGTMPSQIIFRDEATMLSANLFAPPAGKVFAGWNTAANGSGTAYTDQQQVTNLAADGATLTLYAQWRLATPLYDLVAAMSKGTQTVSDIRTAIVTPTESATVSSNSGVYEYNSSVFGTSSDASNTYPIYYYRGILDTYSNMGTYGSDGLADAYPNYVKLANNTCWRIVRTTGSGGVKMIYNGTWSNNTCAKSSSNTNAASSSTYFNRGTPSDSTNNYGTSRFIVYVGYNYNSTYAYNNTSYTSAVANSTLFSNDTASNLRTQLESWYANNMTAYTSILEPSAGYCNDRTTYTGTTTSSLTTSTVPYNTSSATSYFGSYIRNATTNSQPSLNCPNTTGYDLLTTSNGLTYPSAPLTADEAALAGSGYSASTTPYHTNSFLRSGWNFWLLSPSSIITNSVFSFYLHGNGYLTGGAVHTTDGVRPTISLTSGTTPTSGTGTATDPWVIAAP